MKRDIYGNIVGGQMSNMKDAPRPYETEIIVSGNTTTKYTRFYNNGNDPCAVWKQINIKNDDGTGSVQKHEWSFTPWQKRKESTYIPINAVWDDDAVKTGTFVDPNQEDGDIDFGDWTDTNGSDNGQDWTD
jgi:hypothetical protein